MPSLEPGSGPFGKPGDVGVDVPLNVFPWPLPDSTYDYVLCFDVLEHLHNIVWVMEEIHRVSTPGAVVEISVRTGSSHLLCTDPTHVCEFGYHSFDYFVSNRDLADRYRYSQATFSIKRIRFTKLPGRWLGVLDRHMYAFLNADPHVYEYRLSYIYPKDGLHFELLVSKDAACIGSSVGPTSR